MNFHEDLPFSAILLHHACFNQNNYKKCKAMKGLPFICTREA